VQPEASIFSAWESFYVIVGSSAGALTGLQFVVITLVADMRSSSSMREINAFGTPTVVHFCAALLISAILSAPWHRLASAGVTLAVCGGLGVCYTLIVTNRARHATAYHPVFEDWLWHVILPLVAYVDFLIASLLLQRGPGPELFAIGGGALLLLFIGIHNAWDTVTYIALTRDEDKGS
jgi:hypothetical protein